MNESEFYATEMTDAELDAQADAGEFYLDEQGSYLLRLAGGHINNDGSGPINAQQRTTTQCKPT